MRSLLILIVAACGPAAAPPIVARPPAAPPPARPASTSCGDAGVILRGRVDDPRKAGPAKEAVIASACLHDHWDSETLRCIGSAPIPQDCLDKLTEAQRETLDTKLVAWGDLFGESVESRGGGDDHAMARVVECSSGIGNVAAYAPVLTVTGEANDFASALRKQAIEELCNDSWSNEVKQCFEDGGLAETCRAQLEAHEQTAVTDKLTEIDQLVARIAVMKQQPARFDCKKLVAVHYGDAAWKGKAEPRPDPKATRGELAKVAAERKQMIAESRTLMTKACTDERWSATSRACIATGGGDACFRGASIPASRWGFPAVGVIAKTGIPECDAYSAANAALLACNKFPQSAKDAVMQGFEQQRQLWHNATTDQKAAFASMCKQADQAIRQAALSLGC